MFEYLGTSIEITTVFIQFQGKQKAETIWKTDTKQNVLYNFKENWNDLKKQIPNKVSGNISPVKDLISWVNF